MPANSNGNNFDYGALKENVDLFIYIFSEIAGIQFFVAGSKIFLIKWNIFTFFRIHNTVHTVIYKCVNTYLHLDTKPTRTTIMCKYLLASVLYLCSHVRPKASLNTNWCNALYQVYAVENVILCWSKSKLNIIIKIF